MKKLLSLALCAIMATCVALTGCGGPKEETIDDSKSQLYVITSNNGYGVDWLSAIARKFEETYKNVSFEEGKKGVEIHESKSDDAKGNAIMNSFKFNEEANVCFANGLLYNQSIDQGLLADISDVVNGTFDTAVTDVDGNKITMGNDKIADMMFVQQKQVLSARDDKFYSIPWFFQVDGITYNKDIFIEKNLYFANDKVNAIYPETQSSYTGTTYNGRGFIIETTGIKSPGPDGRLGTYDDGLPSSYEEFMYLLDYMKANNVVPFILANIGTWTYSNFLFSGLFTAYNGKEDTLVNYVGQTQGDNTVSIITGFNGDKPIIEEKTVTATDAKSVMSQQAGKYYALTLMEKIFSKKVEHTEKGYYFTANDGKKTTHTGSTHTDAQSYFVNSEVKSGETPIAMLIDHPYWYNESKETIKNMETENPRYKDRAYSILPMPNQVLGTVDENNGRTSACMYSNSDVIINNNIKSAVTMKLAKMFVSYLYTYDNMYLFTEYASMPISMNYKIKPDDYDKLNRFAKDQYDYMKVLIENDCLVYAATDTEFFRNNESYLSTGTDSLFWKGTSGLAYDAFKNSEISVKDYFLSMKK